MIISLQFLLTLDQFREINQTNYTTHVSVVFVTNPKTKEKYMIKGLSKLDFNSSTSKSILAKYTVEHPRIYFYDGNYEKFYDPECDYIAEKNEILSDAVEMANINKTISKTPILNGVLFVENTDVQHMMELDLNKDEYRFDFIYDLIFINRKDRK